AFGPNQTSYTLSAPGGGAVGNFFQITLNNWNTCIPYKNFAGVLTNNQPVSVTSRVVIVTKPDANIRITKNSANITEPEVTKFCPGDRVYLRATTVWPTGAQSRHLISIYDGPDTSFPRIYYRTTNTRNDTSSFKMASNITPGIKTVVIESIDRNANNNNDGIFGCSDNEIKKITVVAAPVAKIVSSHGKIINFCKNNENDEFFVTFGDDPELLDPSNTVFKWRFINKKTNTETVYGPSVGQPLPTFTDVRYFDPGAYEVIYSTEDMTTLCGTTDIVYLNIYSRPIADFEVQSQQIFCERKKIVFKDLSKDYFDLSNLTDDKIITRKWYFDYDNNPNATIEFNEGEEVSHAYTAAGTYKVRLEVETGFAGCSNNVQKDIMIEILPSPVADFTSPPAACPGTFEFTNNSFGNQNPSLGTVSYFWMIYDEDGDFIEEREGNNEKFEYIFTNNNMEDKIYSVRLKAISSNFCDFISSPQDVVVNPAMPARFNSNYDPFEPNCSPKIIQFTVDDQTQTLNVLEYIWTINDSFGFSETISRQPSETVLNYEFLNSSNSVKTYIVSLEVRLNSPFCINPFQQPVKISPIPVADFNITKGIENCDQVTLNFDAPAKGLTYIWTINTNALNNPIINNPIRNDNFNLIFERPEASDADLIVEARLEVVNSTHCRSISALKTFTIPKKSFIPVQLDLLSEDNGCHIFTADFRNNTPAGYPAGTTFDLLIRKGSGMQEIKPVTSGNILGNFSYQFESDGVFEVILRATAPEPDKCVFLSSPHIITVHPAVTASFVPDVEAGCSPLTVHFTETSTNPANIQEIRWIVTNIGTGNIVRDIVQAPGQLLEQLFPHNSSVNTEEYKVLQEVTSNRGCTDTTSVRVKVFPAPQSNFEVVETPICFPYDVQFRNNVVSSNPAGTTYLWYWGDGTFSQSDEEFVVHTYSNTSFSNTRNLTVTLLATTPDECVAISNLPIQVNPRVQANIVADKTSGCSPLEINFNNFSRGQNSNEGSWYKKRVGTETTELISSENLTMLHIFNNLSGVDEQYEVIYIARSTAGCTDTASVVITVFADLVPQFEVTPPYQLLPNRTVTITNNTAPSNWDFIGNLEMERRLHNVIPEPIFIQTTEDMI
ncbi:MAG: PKD domain-containing protein, partial [Bacteroidota bacterium]|nr:PKD domain-containing protein [Bacteroidota bacterium]